MIYVDLYGYISVVRDCYEVELAYRLKMEFVAYWRNAGDGCAIHDADLMHVNMVKTMPLFTGTNFLHASKGH